MLLPEPNRFGAGTAFTWIREGWELMQGSMLAWIGIAFIWLAIMIPLQFVPFIGPLVQVLLTPVFIAGPMLACQAKERDEEVYVSHLFAGFSNRTGALITLALIYFLISLPIGIIVAVFFALSIGFGDTPSGSTILIGLLILLVFLFSISMALVQWLSPQLVVLHKDMTPWGAVKLAVRGILRNLLPFTVLGIVLTVLGILALIPLFLGLLLFMPLMFCVFYAAYRDIFVRPL
jgi:uncharacterized membrane protein